MPQPANFNPDPLSDLIDSFFDKSLDESELEALQARLADDFGAREQLMQTLAADGLIAWALGGPGDQLSSACEEYQGTVRRYHAGALPVELTSRLSRHLTLCTGCQGY